MMDTARISYQEVNFQKLAVAWFSSGASDAFVRTFKRRQYLYREGDAAEHVYCVMSGSVQLSTVAHGHSCPVELRFPGELLGELAVSGMALRHESAIALEAAVVRMVPLSSFMGFVLREGLADAIAAHFASGLLQQQRKIAHLLLEQCERRLALTLLDLSERHGGNGVIPLHLTQAELGYLIGTTRSRVGHFLKRFRSLGLLGHFDAEGLEVNRERLAEYCR